MYQTTAHSKIRLAIFDLDGTLLNTIEDLGNACNHALKSCGCPERKMEEYNRLVGRGIYNLFKGALPEGRKSDDMVLKMKDSFVPYYNEHKTDCTRPYPGIPEMLEELEKKGIALAIASNKYQDGTEKLARHFFGERNFTAILGQRDGKPIKPDPEIVMEAERAYREKYGDIDASETLYAGDSDVDMETGKNAGVITAGVLWGFRTREELESRQPQILAGSPEALLSAILDWKH